MLTTLMAALQPARLHFGWRVVDTILESGKRNVALLGLSFKNGSDDLRESPFVTLAEALIGKGLKLRVCDPDVAVGQLVGRNRAYIDERLPHVAELMDTDGEKLATDAEVVIVAKSVVDPRRLAALLRSDQLVIDLVGLDSLNTAVRPWSGAVSLDRLRQPVLGN